jgi:hypothetical protein
MSLAEIYDILKMIENNNEGKSEYSMEETPLSITLSTEASLMFARKANSLTPNILSALSLCPSGLLQNDCIKIWGFKWYACETILTSRSLINKRNITFGSKHNEVIFSIDSAIIEYLKSRMDS